MADLGAGPTAPGATRRRRTGRRRVLVVLARCALVACLLAAAGLWFVEHELFGQIDRLHGTFTGLHDRPSRPRSGPGADAENILVVSDHGPGGTSDAGTAVMLVHLDGDRRGAAVVKLPQGTGPDVGSVEKATGVHLDHLAVIDWSVFESLADTVGRSVPLRDDGRVRHRQDFLRDLTQDALSQEMRRRPSLVVGLMRTTTRHLAVDEEWSRLSMLRLAISLRDLRSASIRFLRSRETAATEGPGSPLWQAVREDDVEGLLLEHPDYETPYPHD